MTRSQVGLCKTCNGIASAKNHGLTYIVERDSYVKIGHTANLRQRLRVLSRRPLQTICPDGMDFSQPLILRVTLEGNLEHSLHERFAEHHVAGEWFTSGPVLAVFELAPL